MSFNELKNKLETIFFKKNVESLLLYSIVSDEFYLFLSNIDVNATEDMLNKIYNEELNIIDELEKETNDFNKYELAIKLENYFSLIELFTEKSVFSTNVINDFKKKNNENYLNVIKDIDNNNITDIDRDLLNRYLIIKSWQDKQNKLGRLKIEHLLESINYYFENIIDYVFYKLRQKKILDMNTLSNLNSLVSKEKILELIGGKSYGLVKLYSKKVKIPLTYVVLTDTHLTENDLEFLDKSIKYSVRSSATIEDGENHSFAGMFDTYLDVSYDDLINKINLVKSSINSPRVKEYMKENNLANTKMAVVIEEFRKVDYSGIWFGTSINEGIYEYINDIGEKLVSGSTKANRVKYKKNDEITIGKINIGETFIKIQNTFNEICDLEWCIINNELYLLQYRPVTKSVELTLTDKETILNDNEIKALGVSPGIIEGNICYLESFDEEKELKDSCILLTTKTDIRWISILKNIKGLITYKGSLLCHAAIIARELKIPCITYLKKEDYEKLKTAVSVRMDGKRGIIEIKE